MEATGKIVWKGEDYDGKLTLGDMDQITQFLDMDLFEVFQRMMNGKILLPAVGHIISRALLRAGKDVPYDEVREYMREKVNTMEFASLIICAKGILGACVTSPDAERAQEAIDEVVEKKPAKKAKKAKKRGGGGGGTS